MKKLIEGLPFYQDKLHEEAVYARFSEILAKVGDHTVSLLRTLIYILSHHSFPLKGANK